MTAGMSRDELTAFIQALPKAELHLHIEGSLEPELMVALADRNGIDLPYGSVDEVRAAYSFSNLQSFLEIYYQGADVLRTEEDFHDLMAAYLRRAAADGVVRSEMFFDPQTHTARGIGFDVFMPGFLSAMREAEALSGISCALIMCFLRHLPGSDAMATLDESSDWLDDIIGVGLDSSEVGNPPEGFVEVFERAGALGLHRVAHAGEEGPPAYIWGALDVLSVERIDHGVRSDEDAALIDRLVADQTPLTVCPLSNLKLCVVNDLADHNMGRLLDRGVRVMVNSDDPAYFGGYVLDNYVAIAEALHLTRDHLVQLAHHSLTSAFVPDATKQRWIAELAAVHGV